MKQSEEQLLVEEQLVVDLLELMEDVQSLTQRLDVLQRQPVLVELLVYAVHVCRQALVLTNTQSTCFFMRMLWACNAPKDSSRPLFPCSSSAILLPSPLT